MFQILEKLSRKIVNKGFEMVDRNLPRSDGPASETIKGVGKIGEEEQKEVEKTVTPNQNTSEQ